jgi:hypothetical protein
MDREHALPIATLCLRQGIKVCRSVRIVGLRSVRTVKWLYRPYEPYRSWKWFTDLEHTLSIRRKRQWVMLCSSQGRKVFRSVRTNERVIWFYGSYFSCPISHSVNAIIKCMMASYTVCHVENIFFLSDCRWLEVAFPLWNNWRVAVC